MAFGVLQVLQSKWHFQSTSLGLKGSRRQGPDFAAEVPYARWLHAGLLYAQFSSDRKAPPRTSPCVPFAK
eukprot:4585145-Amphidinium_carterae.1